MPRVIVIELTDASADHMDRDPVNALRSLAITFGHSGPVMAKSIRYGQLVEGCYVGIDSMVVERLS